MEQLRYAAAMGADRLVWIDGPAESELLLTARVLAAFWGEVKPELTILGKQAIDDDYNQTGQMMAALLNLPQATFVSKPELVDGRCLCSRETDGGLEQIDLGPPSGGRHYRSAHR
ncbi:Electron transfer flavoprotein subunit beta [Methylacidimicrobium cyclopophantes]|uniref:Electron transfer flavoprotein subunit beta n=1 Tax=Methylacidimicrobium cyclopophantes TaxID=1041766 RepID=A0A5E6MGQ3_9BACT|nr:Electron transfer flavoprotein subunit beta [Methylacidimicrobium cyclopophantes]